eukprot:CAMPEP_0198214324 /NCGR_PEP_ID=MMETSP1445-20131203/40487_1 /TAXON_ID=36898 /ORGANISM="Pyramimonas sp., Strain CCMP2087" /LENGTH=341 /DNA_ID=CAMNT_0043889461 /DNA_START=309 /DNA_END=1331 /DNA_ORIENTATION=+
MGSSTSKSKRDRAARDEFSDDESDGHFLSPVGVVIDGDGNLIVVDSGMHCIHKVTPEGKMVAQYGCGVRGFQDGVGDQAQFDEPHGIALDRDGNLFVADTSNHRIRKITPQGVVSTLAGRGMEGYQDGPRDQAQFYDPVAVAVTADGIVLVADMGNHRIRRITPKGFVSTVAGSGLRGIKDGESTQAQFFNPWGICVGRDGCMIVADMSNHSIRQVTPSGEVTTLAGHPTWGYRSGYKTDARLCNPCAVVVNGDGHVFMTDMRNDCIRKISMPEGLVTTIAGNGESEPGYKDGKGAEAEFNEPHGLAIDDKGNVFVADMGNKCVRKITPEGRVSTIAGFRG